MKRRPYPTTAIPLALIALAGLIAASIATRQLLWMIASYVASVCIIGFLIAFALRRRYKPAPGESPISLVLLLSEPRYLDANILSKLAGKAWGVPMLDIPLSENYVRGSSPLFHIRTMGISFIVNYLDAPYFQEPQKVAAEMREMRLRKVVTEHRAWLSVEFVESNRWMMQARVYQLIGKLISELCDRDCLAVHCPATGGINIYDDEIRLALCEKDPMELLNNFSQPPVLNISENDPRMRDAIAEARKRWPEFVDAFERRSADQHFSVKAPFGDGQHTEFMWVGVTAIENDIIYGELGNEPVHVRGMSAGETVKVRIADMNDWLFMEGERMRGGFTIEAIRQAESDR